MRNAITTTAVLVMAFVAAACSTGSGGGSVSGLGPACGKGDASLPGAYTLEGVPETGSQLRLNKDGSFEFYLAYGANDQYGKGCWTQYQNNIALIPAGKRTIAPDHTPDTRGFTGILLVKQGSDLVWNIPGSHVSGRYVKG